MCLVTRYRAQRILTYDVLDRDSGDSRALFRAALCSIDWRACAELPSGRDPSSPNSSKHDKMPTLADHGTETRFKLNPEQFFFRVCG